MLGKINPKIGIISKLRHYLPKFVLVLLYNSLILPHLSYCLEVWGNTYRSSLDPILKAQKKLVRIITFNDSFTHSKPLFHTLGILDIYSQFKCQICIFIHDLINNRLPRNFSDYFSFIQHSYQTRSVTNCNISIPRKTFTLSQYSLDYHGGKIWNDVPHTIRNITNRNAFKSAIKEYFLIRQ